MVRVLMEGWKQGLNKVELNRLLRQHAGYGLAEAKHAVDRLLEGGRLELELPDRESARSFCASAVAIGAVCSTASEDVSNPTLAKR
jgi:ribosomal protein L7/L12